MHADERDQQSRNHEHMQREKARKRCACNDRPAQQQIHEPRTQQRDPAHDGCANSQSPIRILIESQHLARKGHAERHQEKQDANHPGQFSRIFVRAEEEDLGHVDQDNRNHEIRAPAVQGPDEPPQSDLVIESLQAIPGFSRRGDINSARRIPVTI